MRVGSSRELEVEQDMGNVRRCAEGKGKGKTENKEGKEETSGREKRKRIIGAPINRSDALRGGS